MDQYEQKLANFFKENADAFEVHADGGARPNPGNGGFGYIVTGPDKTILEEGYGSVPEATNNQMELCGAIAGYRLLPDGAKAIFLTDSKLVYTGMGQNLDKDPRPRFVKWEERGWKNVKNPELVQQLYALWKEHETRCIPRPLNQKGTDYARMGHEGHGASKLPDGRWEFPYNKICDKLAEYGEHDAAAGKKGMTILIRGGKTVGARALFVADRDACGHGRVVGTDGAEVSVN